MCVEFLLKQAGFDNVLTRTFSSDAVEATFSQIRLKGGSNDATDARAAEYGLQQILRCGVLIASASANTAGRINHVRHNQFGIRRSTIIEHNEDVLLPDYLNSKIYGLYRNEDSENNLYSV